MFKIEQNIAKTSKNPLKKGFITAGIPFVEHTIVKRRITYKEMTLILGILVAVLVSLTLWVASEQQIQHSQSTIFPSIDAQAMANATAKARTLVVILADIFF